MPKINLRLFHSTSINLRKKCHVNNRCLETSYKIQYNFTLKLRVVWFGSFGWEGREWEVIF
jgi:hypothetical protein